MARRIVTHRWLTAVVVAGVIASATAGIAVAVGRGSARTPDEAFAAGTCTRRPAACDDSLAEGITASVDGVPIPEAALLSVMQNAIAGASGTNVTEAQLRRSAIANAVFDLVVLDEAEQAGVTVTTADATADAQAMIDQFRSGGSEWETQFGMSVDAVATDALTPESIEARRKSMTISRFETEVIAPAAKSPAAAMAARVSWFADATKRHEINLANAGITATELASALATQAGPPATPSTP